MPVSAAAIRALQRALLDVCVQQIEDVGQAVDLWQRLDQVLADALTGRAVAATEAAGVTRPVADDAARRVVPKPMSQFPSPSEAHEMPEERSGTAREAPGIEVQPAAPPPAEHEGPGGNPAVGASASHVEQPEPPLEIPDEPRPPAVPRLPPPKAKRITDPLPPINGGLRPWTAEEDAKVAAWQAEGKSVRWIAEQIGRSLGATQVRISKVRAAAKAGPQNRRCLNCSRLFVSSHIGNRLCPRCDGRSEGIAA